MFVVVDVILYIICEILWKDGFVIFLFVLGIIKVSVENIKIKIGCMRKIKIIYFILWVLIGIFKYFGVLLIIKLYINIVSKININKFMSFMFLLLNIIFSIINIIGFNLFRGVKLLCMLLIEFVVNVVVIIVNSVDKFVLNCIFLFFIFGL